MWAPRSCRSTRRPPERALRRRSIRFNSTSSGSGGSGASGTASCSRLTRSASRGWRKRSSTAPTGATTELQWDPGDYAGVDVAPLVRFAPQFAAGVTAAYWTRQRDRYTFRSTQDSLDLAARLGAPTSAAWLDEGTSEQRLRFGVALTYVGPTVEGGFSIEQTVSG